MLTPGEDTAVVDAADDEHAKHRTTDSAVSPLYSVVADARAAASGSGGARPPRSPSRGLPQMPDSGGPRHRRTPSAADRSAREVRSQSRCHPSGCCRVRRQACQ